MKLSVSSYAEQELIDAVEYYNHQQGELGYEFAREVQKPSSELRNIPTHGPLSLPAPAVA